MARHRVVVHPPTTSRVRAWLRLLLLCSVFSALHAPLGAWVVSSLSDGHAVQICTAQGPQWVSLDEADARAADEAPEQATSLKPCVWASAQLAIEQVAWPSWRGLVPGHGHQPTWAPPPVPSDHAWRVLLMSAMRAPPAARG